MKTFLLALAATLLVLAAYNVSAQDDLSTFPGKPQKVQGSSAKHMETCKAMRTEMQADKTRLDQMDSKMVEMVNVMENATGEYKVTSMGAALKELVYQRTTLRTMKQTMEGKMRGHMMDHSKMSANGGKMDCPMMTEPM